MIESKKIERLLKKAEKPGRYIGGEVNEIVKAPKDGLLRFGFAFPDLYEIGMSYLGLQILYRLLNAEDDIFCERIFAPAADMEALMREAEVPLFTLETKTPARALDLIGFTLQYELSYSNVVNMLSLAGLPPLSKDRTGDMPFVVGGGPCAFNPEPLADIFDLFIVGDGEEALLQLCETYRSWKKTGQDRGLPTDDSFRESFLRSAREITGVYAPRYFEPVYRPDGVIEEIRRLDPDAPSRARKAITPDLNASFYPVDQIVPLVQTVHDRAVMEIFRGCGRGCRFCQSGMVSRPIRERTKETILKTAAKLLRGTGQEELSLLSLSTSDYSEFEPLVTELMDMCRKQDVSLSLPSLRLDSFSFPVLRAISGYKKTGLTFAPEAGSQRLRDVINKGVTEEDILGSIRQAAELGYGGVKLYFMIGLPTETDEDLDAIAALTRKIKTIAFEVRGAKGKPFQITVNVSNFVPKPHTPFQWAAQDTAGDFVRKHDHLKRKLKMKGVTYRYHDSATSVLEAVFARGDRRITPALLRAVELGCKFDGWSESFRWDLWARAFQEAGVDIDFYTARERAYDEVLPWDVIDCLVSKEHLIRENEKARQAETTADCRQRCAGCGVQTREKEGV